MRQKLALLLTTNKLVMTNAHKLVHGTSAHILANNDGTGDAACSSDVNERAVDVIGRQPEMIDEAEGISRRGAGDGEDERA